MRVLLVALVVSACVRFDAAHAQPAIPSAGSPSDVGFGTMSCAAPEGLQDLVFGDDTMRVNNIVVREGVLGSSTAEILRVTASVVSNAPTQSAVSVEVVGLYGAEIGFAVTALPARRVLAPNEAAQLYGWTVHPRGEASTKTDKVCVRVSRHLEAAPAN